MSVDTNTHENYFTQATDSEKSSWWDSVVGGAGQVVGQLPGILDGLANYETAKNTTTKNENIISKDPAVPATANAESFLSADTKKYMVIGGGSLAALIGLALLYKLVK